MMQKCLACEEEFFIRDEDLAYYEKISPVLNGKKILIPPPKLCPLDRMLRRMANRNERNLYRTKSVFSGKEMISCFPPDTIFKIFTRDEWWSDSWDAMNFGQDFDFSRGFFEQFYELQKKVPRPPLINNKSENADFCNFADGNKNCYLITAANDNEDCYYGTLMAGNRNCVDMMWALEKNELCYECIDCHHCYNVRFSQSCENCMDSSFLLNCRAVKNSLFCVNLRNKEYWLFNEPSTREIYEKTMKELAGSYEKYGEAKKRFEELKQQFPVRRAATIINCENCEGDCIYQSQNVYHGFDIFTSKDCAYLHDGLKGNDCFDVCYYDRVQFCYESNSLMGYGYRFTNFCRDSYDLFYCDNCHGCRNCFGCVGLHKKEYCIFNKQYSKEGYEELMARIIGHMESRGEWGEFFPIQYSLFSYNESIAQDFATLTKEEVLERGWQWQEKSSVQLQPQKIALPDNVKETNDSVCNEILSCTVCQKNYRLIPQEFAFYRRMELPLPRKCPETRFLERLALRNPFKLWTKKCQKCDTAIKTNYAPDRPEKVYCEKCYLEELY